MVSFKVVCARFLIALLFALSAGFVIVEVAAAQTPPPAPDQIWFHSRTRTTLEISWGASDTATGYQIYIEESGVFQPKMSISEIDAAANAADAGISNELRLAKLENLDCSSEFTLVIGAINQHGESTSSPKLEAYTDSCPTLLPPVLTSPLNNTLLNTNTDVYLKWMKGDQFQVDNFRLEVWGPGNYEVTVETDSQEWGLGKLYPGDYFWKVSARRGEEVAMSEVFQIHISYYMDPALPRPTLIYPLETDVITEGQPITLTWDASLPDSQGVWLEVSEENGDYEFQTFVISPTELFGLGALLPGQYQWRGLSQTPQFQTQWSEISYFTVQAKIEEPSEPVVPPQLVSPLSGTVVLSGTAVVFKWSEAGAEKYHFELEGYNYLLNEVVSGTSITVEGLLPSWYFWKVQSESMSVKSEWSPKSGFVVDTPLDPVIDCAVWEGSPDVHLFTQKDCAGQPHPMSLGPTDLHEVNLANRVISIAIPPGMSVRIRESVNGTRTKCYANSMWDVPADSWWQTNILVGSSVGFVVVYDNPDCSPLKFRLAMPFLFSNN